MTDLEDRGWFSIVAGRTHDSGNVDHSGGRSSPPPLVPVAAAGLHVITSRVVLRVAASICLAWSIAAAALGAFVYPPEQWNNDPLEVDRYHARLWDWRDMQLKRALKTDWSPQNFDRPPLNRPARQELVWIGD